MDLMMELTRTPRLRIECPECGRDFPIKRGFLFDATRTLPDRAAKLIESRRADLHDRRLDLRARKTAAQERPELAGRTVRIGKVVEKIAPTLPGFPVQTADCRSLLEPIDYIVFKGLSMKGSIEEVEFVEVKSGGATLSVGQRQIRDAVEHGRVRLIVANSD